MLLTRPVRVVTITTLVVSLTRPVRVVTITTLCCVTHTPCTCYYYYNRLLCHSYALYVLLLLQPFVVSLTRPVRVVLLPYAACITRVVRGAAFGELLI